MTGAKSACHKMCMKLTYIYVAIFLHIFAVT